MSVGSVDPCQGLYGAEWVSQLQRRLRRECVNFGRPLGRRKVEKWREKVPKMRGWRLAVVVFFGGNGSWMLKLEAKKGQ